MFIFKLVHHTIKLPKKKAEKLIEGGYDGR